MLSILNLLGVSMFMQVLSYSLSLNIVNLLDLLNLGFFKIEVFEAYILIMILIVSWALVVLATVKLSDRIIKTLGNF
jgi:hypothetical protein